MRHDERADESRADAPTCGPSVLLVATAASEGNAGSMGKVLPQEMARACLDGLAILHHGFDAERGFRAWKAFARALLAAEDRDGQMVANEGLINTQHGLSFLEGLLLRFMCRVAFLPEEFRSAQENARTHFPTHDIGPLVDQ